MKKITTVTVLLTLDFQAGGGGSVRLPKIYRKITCHSLLVGMQTDTATLEIRMENPQKLKLEMSVTFTQLDHSFSNCQKDSASGVTDTCLISSAHGAKAMGMGNGFRGKVQDTEELK